MLFSDILRIKWRIGLSRCQTQPSGWVNSSYKEESSYNSDGITNCLLEYQVPCDHKSLVESWSQRPSSKTWERKSYFEHEPRRSLGSVVSLRWSSCRARILKSLFPLLALSRQRGTALGIWVIMEVQTWLFAFIVWELCWALWQFLNNKMVTIVRE